MGTKVRDIEKRAPEIDRCTQTVPSAALINNRNQEANVTPVTERGALKCLYENCDNKAEEAIKTEFVDDRKYGVKVESTDDHLRGYGTNHYETMNDTTSSQTSNALYSW